MFDRKELKTKAKQVLSGSYFMVFVACLAVTIASGGLTGSGAQKLQYVDFEQMSNLKILAICAIMGLLVILGTLFYIFVTSPIVVGLKKFMLNTTKGGCNIRDLLYPFKNNYKNITLTMFLKTLYVFLWSTLSFIPTIIAFCCFDLHGTILKLVEGVRQDSISSALMLMGISTLLLIFTIIFSIPSIIKDLQYSMVQYILADDPDMRPKSVIERSKEMMIGNKWAFVKLLFSFTGWYLLCTFACCLGSIVLTPYVEATVAQMYIKISGQEADYEHATFQQTNFFNNFGNF